MSYPSSLYMLYLDFTCNQIQAAADAGARWRIYLFLLSSVHLFLQRGEPTEDALNHQVLYLEAAKDIEVRGEERGLTPAHIWSMLIASVRSASSLFIHCRSPLNLCAHSQNHVQLTNTI